MTSNGFTGRTPWHRHDTQATARSSLSRLAGAIVLCVSLCACAGRDGQVPQTVGNAAAQPSTDRPDTPERPGRDEMRSFERFIGGEWRMTSASGTSMFDRWHWGPGEHSVRVMTDGQAADGRPWRELQAFYWHPGRKQIALLGLSPYKSGVSEGTIVFDGDRAEAIIDLHQTGGLRRVQLQWSFQDRNRYHEALLERIGSGDYEPLTDWIHIRGDTSGARLSAAEDAPPSSGPLRPFGPLLGHRWEGSAPRAGAESLRLESTFEWVPYANGIYERILTLSADGVATHRMDVYIYHHTGRDLLRALALSADGGVYEGDVTVDDAGALVFDLQGYEGDHQILYRASLELEPDGTLRRRLARRVEGTTVAVLDLRMTRAEAERR